MPLNAQKTLLLGERGLQTPSSRHYMADYSLGKQALSWALFGIGSLALSKLFKVAVPNLFSSRNYRQKQRGITTPPDVHRPKKSVLKWWRSSSDRNTTEWWIHEQTPKHRSVRLSQHNSLYLCFVATIVRKLYTYTYTYKVTRQKCVCCLWPTRLTFLRHSSKSRNKFKCFVGFYLMHESCFSPRVVLCVVWTMRLLSLMDLCVCCRLGVCVLTSWCNRSKDEH